MSEFKKPTYDLPDRYKVQEDEDRALRHSKLEEYKSYIEWFFGDEEKQQTKEKEDEKNKANS